MAKNYHAAPSLSHGWAVSRAGSKRALRRGLTKDFAWRMARRLARGQKGIAYLHNEAGTIVTRTDYGE